MHPTYSNRRIAAGASLALLLASVTLAACGGSSGTGGDKPAGGTSVSTPGHVASVPASTSAGSAAKTSSARSTAITGAAAHQSPGTTAAPSPSTSAPVGAPKSTAGKTTGSSGSLEAAIKNCVRKVGAKKCGLPSGASAGASAGVKLPGEKVTSTTGEKPGGEGFIACLRANGVKVPTESEKGSVPATSSSSPVFKAAVAKCIGELSGGA